MDEKKEEQSSQNSTKKSESETSTGDAIRMEEEKISDEEISAKIELGTSPGSSSVTEKEQAREETEKPVSQDVTAEPVKEEEPESEGVTAEPVKEEEPESEEVTAEPVKEEEPVSEEVTAEPVKEEEPETEEVTAEPVSEKAIPEKEEEPAPPPKVIVKEITESPKNRIIRKIKRTSLIILLIIGLIFIGGVYAWTSGMDDLRDDNDYLIVVVYKDVPKAASIYHRDTEESDIVDVVELGALSRSNRKTYFNNVQKKYGVLDRMIIIDVDTLKLLSTDAYILYQDDPEKEIYRDEMHDWIIGKDFPRKEIQGNDSPSVVNANMLKSWLDHYQEKLFGNWGSNTVKVVLNGYRAGDIVIHPGNSALFILKYIAVEKIFLPV